MSDVERDKPVRKAQVSDLFETGFELKESPEKLVEVEERVSLPSHLVDTNEDISVDVSEGKALSGERTGSGSKEEADSEPEAEAEIDPLVGTIFADKYEVLSILGKGGMSTVYKVQHQDLGMVLALKVLHKHLWTDPLSVERFRLEAKTIGKLSSPYLITFRDFGVTSDGQPYLVMDYLKGVSLGRKIYDENGLELGDCLEIFSKLCEGLAEAHRNGVTHRDIKPANVMFLTDGSDSSVKLVDFGIAKLAQGESDQRLTLTQTGEVFGSPLYMSPEQCLGLSADHRSDIYSLGCLFYEAVVGTPPFVGSNVLETMNSHVDKEPDEIMKGSPELAQKAQELGFEIKDLNYVVMKCLQKLPADRYQDVSEIQRDLDKLKAKKSITGKQKLWKKPEPKRKLYLGILAGLSSLLIAFTALYFVNPQFKGAADNLALQANWQYNLSMGQLAFTLRDFQAAETHFRDSLELANSMNPADKHVKRLAALEALSGALQYQGKYQDKDRVIEEHKKELRQSLGNLANVQNLDDDESEELDVQPETKEAALASALLFDKFGTQAARAGKTAVAVKYFEKSYELKKAWLEEGNESLIKSMDALASVYVLERKHREAGKLWRQAFRQAEKYLSDESSVKVSLYDNMGRMNQEHGSPEASEHYYKRAIEIATKHFGEGGISTIKVKKDYAALLTQIGRKQEADALIKNVEELESRAGK